MIFLWIKVFSTSKLQKTKSNLAECGACGYPTQGLSELSCAECGSDFREVGIVSPKQRKQMITPIVFIGLWTLFWPLPGFVIATITTLSGPSQTFSNDMISLEPYSREYNSIDIDDMKISGWFNFATSPNTSPEIAVSFSGNNAQTEYLWVDPIQMSYDPYMASFNTQAPITSHTNPTSITSTQSLNHQAPFDQAAALAALQYIGADITKTEVIAEVNELILLIQNQPNQGLTQTPLSQFQLTNNSMPIDLPLLWFGVTSFIAMFLIWPAGIFFYFHIRKKRKPCAKEKHSSPDPYGPPRFASSRH